MIRVELFVDDVTAAEAFYVDVLGFTVAGGRGRGSYVPLVRGAARLSLQDLRTLPPDHPCARTGKVTHGPELVLEVEDVAEAYERARQQWPLTEPLARRPWGLVDFRVLDPDGHYWRVTERPAAHPTALP